jgi:DNA-binding response OmpR family regulator
MNAQRKKILIADCHEEILITLQKLLEDAGFDTTTVWTAKDFVHSLHSGAFDLVLINEYLPDARCEELLHKLDEKLLTCIFMQPRAAMASHSTALAALAGRDVVCKYDYAEILELVWQRLGGQNEGAAA